MRKKNIVRVNESRLLEIISECVRRAVNEQFERVNGDFASITYLPLIDMYRVEWHDHIFRDAETERIQTPGVRNSVRTKKFGSEEEAERYCQENNLKIVNRSSLKDVAFPDVRSIRPNVHPLMEGVIKISDVPSPLKRAYLKLDNYGEVSGLSRKQQLELADFCKSNGIECECGCAEYGFFVRKV